MKNVNAKLVRESNPWGPRSARWSVELHETIHGMLVDSTDLKPSRFAAMQDAFALAKSKGYNLVVKES